MRDRRDNPSCQANVARLLAAWRAASRPVVLVRHDSADPASPLHPGRGGNDVKDVITARTGGNLGLDVLFVLDATHTFDRTAPDGSTVTAEELSRVTATNLHGEFATVVGTDQVVAASTS